MNTFEHVGTFKLKEELLKGTLRYSKENNNILLKIEKPFSIEFFNKRKKDYNITICGELENGLRVTLIDCEQLNSGMSFQRTYTYYKCKYLICGVKYSAVKPRSLYCTIENGLDWSDLRGLKYKFPIENAVHEIEFKEKTKQISYKGYEITFSNQYNTSLFSTPISENNTFTERLAIDIKSEIDQPFTNFVEILEDILNLITFCSDNNVNTLSYFIGFGQFYNDDNKNKEIRYQMVDCKERFPVYNSYINTYEFGLNQLQDNILNKYLDSYSILKPIIELYNLIVKYPYEPMFVQFINSIQALESFHSLIYYGSNKSQLKKFKKEIKLRFGENEPFFTKYLIDDTQTDQYYLTLPTRIKDCFSRLPKQVFDYFTDGKICDKLCATRNYYTHYNRNKKDMIYKDFALQQATKLILYVLRYLIFSYLGLDTSSTLTNCLNSLDYDLLKD